MQIILNGYDILVGTSFDTNRIIDDVKIDRPKYVFAFHGLVIMVITLS